jgi:hypothetical protein
MEGNDDGLNPQSCVTYEAETGIPQEVLEKTEQGTGATAKDLLAVMEGDDCLPIRIAPGEECESSAFPVSSTITFYGGTTTAYLKTGDIAMVEGKSTFSVERDKCGNAPYIYTGQFKLTPKDEVGGEIELDILNQMEGETSVLNIYLYVLDGTFEASYNAEVIASTTADEFYILLKSKDGEPIQVVFMEGDGTIKRVDEYKNGEKEGTYFFDKEGEVSAYEKLNTDEEELEGTTGTPSIGDDDIYEPAGLYLEVQGEIEDVLADLDWKDKDKDVYKNTEIKVSPGCGVGFNNIPTDATPGILLSMLAYIGVKGVAGGLNRGKNKLAAAFKSGGKKVIESIRELIGMLNHSKKDK